MNAVLGRVVPLPGDINHIIIVVVSSSSSSSAIIIIATSILQLPRYQRRRDRAERLHLRVPSGSELATRGASSPTVRRAPPAAGATIHRRARCVRAADLWSRQRSTNSNSNRNDNNTTIIRGRRGGAGTRISPCMPARPRAEAGSAPATGPPSTPHNNNNGIIIMGRLVKLATA